MPTLHDVLAAPDRLAAIAASELLTSGAVPALDRVVRTAGRLLHAPVAQLNVVTADRQVPISYIGGDSWGRAVTLDRSYCQHVVRTGQPLVVEDAREHPLVRDCLATRDSGIVAYLSVPILSPRASLPIATLCVVEFGPRVWTDGEVATLTDLAAWALSEVELRTEHLRDKIQAEEALGAAESRLRLALDTADLGDWELDLRTRRSPRRSPRHDHIFGYREPVRDWSYERFLQHVHPEDRGEVDRLFRAALEGGEAWDFECRIVRVDGEVRWIWGRGGIHRDASGEPLQAHGLVQDITERKAAEAAVRAMRSEADRAAQVTSLITTHLADGVCMLDADGKVTFMNPAAERILGWSQTELQGRVLHDVAHHRRSDGSPRPPEQCPVLHVIWSGTPLQEAVDEWVHRDGSFVQLVTTCTPLLDDGRVTGAVLSLHDDTERRRAEAERERLLREAEAARADAEAANRAKSEFLAVMSHELRTPLNAISGYVELLDLGIHGPVSPRQHDALRRIQVSQRHLLGLINEVLNYARLDTGSVHYDVTDVRVHEVMAEVEGLVAPQVRDKGLVLRFRDCGPGLTAWADAEKLRQILVNLLSNAIKFTDAGGEIEVSCSADSGRVRFQVRDTGIGIPADKLDRIFEPFVQVRSDLTRTAEGTGLGLAISRDLARRMGGDLTVSSELHVGSTFVLTLPENDDDLVDRRTGEDRRSGDDRRAAALEGESQA